MRLMERIGREPDLKLAGLSFWIVDRQFPDSSDYWDGNWLRVLVRVEATQAIVETDGPIVHSSELAAFVDELERLDRTLDGTASLTCLEPNLNVFIEANTRGHAVATIKITPDHLTQSHEFVFEIDQSYLKPLISQCRQVLKDYPIKSVRPE
jgi:hypothetical protein